LKRLLRQESIEHRYVHDTLTSSGRPYSLGPNCQLRRAPPSALPSFGEAIRSIRQARFEPARWVARAARLLRQRSASPQGQRRRCRFL